MNFTKFVTMMLAITFCATGLIGSPISVQAAPTGTGKTLGAVIVAANVDAAAQDAGNGVDLGEAEAQDQQAGASDVEWKYVPVRRISG